MNTSGGGAVDDGDRPRRCLRCWEWWAPGHQCATDAEIELPMEPIAETRPKAVDATPKTLTSREYVWVTANGTVPMRFNRLISAHTLPDYTDLLTYEDGRRVTVRHGWAFCIEIPHDAQD